MTQLPQLDLPPISIARYLDLLKRRRWQVVPVSLLGLLVGGLVAFFIPRYYVARTIIHFRGSVLETGRGENPLKPLVDNAKITLPLSAWNVVEELGWKESMVKDRAEQQALEAELQKNIRVTDRFAKSKMTANLGIIYKDVDGTRARDFANTLRDLWIREQTEELEEKASKELHQVTERLLRANTALRNLDSDIANFQRLHKIEPRKAFERQTDPGITKLQQLNGAEDRVTILEDQETEFDLTLQRKNKLLSGMRPKKLVDKKVAIPQSIEAGIAQLQQKQEWLKSILKDLNPVHPQYKTRAAELAKVEKELIELSGNVGLGEQVEVDNPDYQKLVGEIAELETTLKATRAKLARARAKRDKLVAEFAELPGIHEEYDSLLQRQRMAREKVEALVKELDRKEARKRQISNEKPYKVLKYAKIPPRPTEPNIVLVALAGCVVGLAVAIGLILLIDFMQSTFKTVSDVERMLPLPVLGGISHMLPAHRQREVVARRTRAGLVAAVVLVMMLSLVTLYYVDPTRLPPVIRDTLDMLLGSTSPLDTTK